MCGGVCQCVHMCVRAWLWLRYTHTHTHTQTHTHKAAADKVERGDAEARDCKFISLFFFNFITTGRSRQGKTRRGRSGRFQICAGARRLGPGTARRGNKKQDMACSRYVQCQKRPTTVSKETYYMYNMPASPVRTCTPWSNDTSRSLLMTLVGLFCITCLPPLYARVRLGQMCGN